MGPEGNIEFGGNICKMGRNINDMTVRYESLYCARARRGGRRGEGMNKTTLKDERGRIWNEEINKWNWWKRKSSARSQSLEISRDGGE
jgi:hypothetical protein